jgi:hypothetical protein
MRGEWKAGDTSAAECGRCKKIVATRYEHRTVQMARTRVRVSAVLVDVCGECDHMISIPRQSIAQLRQVGAA